MKKILVLGQVPPPLHGQAVMTAKMLAGNYPNIRLYHIPMRYSSSTNEVGRFTWFKVWHLFELIIKTYFYVIRHRPKTLYYIPCGPNRIPMYRDIVFLVCTRFLFRQTIFHFHAAGLTELYPSLSPIERFWFRRAYYRPQIGLRLSEYSPQDCHNLLAEREFILPNGIDDEAKDVLPHHIEPRTTFNILFVGSLHATKGEGVLLEACALLHQRGYAFRVNVMGKFHTPEYQEQLAQKVIELGIDAQVCFLGVLSGAAKQQQFTEAHVLVLPSFYESENQPVVLIEACQYALPMVATHWRGIPSIISEGENGFLIPPHDVQALADKLALLADNPTLCQHLGEKARLRYLQEYSIEAFHRRFNEVFSYLKY